MTTKKRKIVHAVLALVLVGLGVLGMGALIASKPEMERKQPESPKPVVRVLEVHTGTNAVVVKAEGTVRPLQEVQLVPEVSGKVVFVSPALVNGGEFRDGETLLRIEQEEYRLAVTLARAKVKDSESRLQLIEEEAAEAREEWRLHNESRGRSSKEPPPLVAKIPQLHAAQARLEADKADLRRAELNLERTELRAPFNGRCGEENVGIGQHILVGQKLGTLYGTDTVEIVLPIESDDLQWFHVPGFTPGESPGAPAVVRAVVAGHDREWQGHLVRSEGKVDERTRMVHVVVRVEKPYAVKPPLAVGLFVSVEIQGKALPESALIPRAALREGDMVWVVEGDRLRFRKIGVARMAGEKVLIRSGLRSGERIVVSPLKAVTDNMVVRSVPAEEKPS